MAWGEEPAARHAGARRSSAACLPRRQQNVAALELRSSPSSVQAPMRTRAHARARARA
eukprot:CAMPEP_0204571690 /NCGR_PEP_ID=MMETSP0661-20131031/39032_1 /ASSEMBLY_ACC=CAM_ASM_000606 /TAXON_ID=109239 /ORGANISM="Alexandrium margalefi, Strain AMGDE01CS-322" /LENGTH=57 /DNA_ID=CAMNT_0051579971 /DNA_START=15 /DNA_END=185 /DNA_ORIENTATION=-